MYFVTGKNGYLESVGEPKQVDGSHYRFRGKLHKFVGPYGELPTDEQISYRIARMLWTAVVTNGKTGLFDIPEKEEARDSHEEFQAVTKSVDSPATYKQVRFLAYLTDESWRELRTLTKKQASERITELTGSK